MIKKPHLINIKDFLVIAHRGWSGVYPENTLIAFERAIEIGSHVLELDVGLSKDNHLIILHNETLNLTTNSKGLVRKKTLSEIKILDAGSWFHPIFKNTKVPTLEEILELVKKHKKIILNIEIKPEFWNSKKNSNNIEELVLKSVFKYGLESRVFISSFHWGYLLRIRKLTKKIKLALLHCNDDKKYIRFQSGMEGFERYLPALDLKYLNKTYEPIAINPQSGELSQNFVNLCHQNRIKVLPYTVNTYTEMEKFLNMGVDGLFTNHPNRLQKFIIEHLEKLHKYHNEEILLKEIEFNDVIKQFPKLD